MWCLGKPDYHGLQKTPKLGAYAPKKAVGRNYGHHVRQHDQFRGPEILQAMKSKPRYEERQPEFRVVKSKPRYEERQPEFRVVKSKPRYEERQPEFRVKSKHRCEKHQPAFRVMSKHRYEERQPEIRVVKLKPRYEERQPEFRVKSKHRCEKHQPAFRVKSKPRYEERQPEFRVKSKPRYEERQPEFRVKSKPRYEERQPEFRVKSKHRCEKHQPAFRVVKTKRYRVYQPEVRGVKFKHCQAGNRIVTIGPEPTHNARPTAAEEQQWDHRYDGKTSRPNPAKTSIDREWRLIQSIASPDGAFNGGIDLLEHKESGEMAIRKRLCRQPYGLKDEHRSWKHEMRLMRKLRHPNIPYYIDGFYTLEKGSLYMQPCRYGNLSQFAQSQYRMEVLPLKMQEYFLWYALHEVAQAVLYLQTGFKSLAEARRADSNEVSGWIPLVHGDIRPDQVFIAEGRKSSTPCLVLGDFGFGQFIRPWRRTEVHEIGGKSSSKPPEFPDEISAATDVFALGATAQLYIAPREKVKRGLGRGWLSRMGFSKELDHLVCECVALKPSDRPPIRDLLSMLEYELSNFAKEGITSEIIHDSWFKTIF